MVSIEGRWVALSSGNIACVGQVREERTGTFRLCPVIVFHGSEEDLYRRFLHRFKELGHEQAAVSVGKEVFIGEKGEPAEILVNKMTLLTLVELTPEWSEEGKVAEPPPEQKVGPAEWLDPDWNEGGQVHNWHNHVPEEVRALWPTFTEAQRKAIHEWADRLAGEEHWD